MMPRGYPANTCRGGHPQPRVKDIVFVFSPTTSGPAPHGTDGAFW
jgi:hypothetical protein